MHPFSRVFPVIWLLTSLACTSGVTADEDAPADPAHRILLRIQEDPQDAMQVAGAWLDELTSNVTAGPEGEAFEADLVDAAFAYRLSIQMQSVSQSLRRSVMPFLLEHQDLAKTVVFLISADDEPSEVWGVFDRLREQRGDQLASYATLTAAICVVHDKPVWRYVNENRVKAEDPLVIFDYYRKVEPQSNFGIRRLPGELLVYVVDVAASAAEMQWALKRYRGDNEVGRRFFDVRYDTTHFTTGRPKRVTEAGYTLPNIQRYGGICADQAHFASTIGKAIGVPAVYTRARGATVSHAWVGFLQVDRRDAAWNFDIGRYEAYRKVPGTVLCPQTERKLNHSVVALTAELIGTSTRDRFFAAACAEGAERLMYAADQRPPQRSPGETGKVAQDVEADRVLWLLERGLRRSPANGPSWTLVAELAAAGAMAVGHKQRWADVVLRLCGEKYPDFAVDLLAPMIATVEDLRKQQALWHLLAKQMPTERKDLMARLTMHEARMWEEQANNLPRAGRCYLEVIDRYLNDGPYVLEAMAQCERLLAKANNPGGMLTIYDRAWKRVDRPRDGAPEFRRQSNWAKIGQRYAHTLTAAGRVQQARQVVAQLDRVLDSR